MDLRIYIALKRLNRLKNEEITSEIGLVGEVEDLTKLLSDLKSNLTNSRLVEEVVELIKRINEVALQIEDAVEHHRPNSSTIKSSYSCFCWSRLYTYDTSIITQKIRQLSLDYRNHNYYHIQEEDKKSTSLFENAIGLDKSVIDEIIPHLIRKNDDSQNNLRVVVSLCGIGGVGKTTIAEQVVANNEIAYEFYYIHWITVTSNYSIRDVLVQILRKYTTKFEKYDNHDEFTLAKMVTENIRKDFRCLFILDDVWSTQVLDDLQRLLDITKGYAILVTTRKRQVAEFGIPKPFIITVRGLTQNGAWELFMSVYRRHNGGDHELINGDMEDICRKMVERCGGYPVGIIKLAQVLADRKSLAERNAVHKHLMSFLNDTVLQVLASSFDDLPDHLKLCFVYLGLWPEDSFIDVEKLYHFWIVEGLVINQLDMRVGGAPFDIAERYLSELEKMGMVEVEDEEAPTVSRLKFCRIHQMMRLLSISKGNEIDFIQSFDSRNTVRRLSLCLQSPEDMSSIDQITKKEHLHNLHILDPHKRTPLSFNIEKLKLLRLVDFDGVNFGWDKNLSADDDQNMSYVRKKESSDLVLQGLSKLVHLKYLSFRRCFLNQYLSFPITNLEILDLRVDDMINEVTLPNVLWKMRKMKHLYLPHMFRTCNGDKLRLDGMIELETLDNLITKVCDVTHLQTMNKLHWLSVKIDGDLPDLQVINEHLKKTHSNGHIIHLSIDIRNFDCFVDKRHSLIREVLQYPGVQIFCIEGHINELPSRYNICPSLTKLVLIGSELEKDPMQKLYKLPNLRVLVLDDNAFEGTDMVSPASGFTQLRHLQLLNLKFLESWTVENNSMPKLSNIKIENCNKLKIPIGLEFLTALKELEIAKMPKYFLHLLQKMETTQVEDTALVNYEKITFRVSDEITRSEDDDDKAKASSSG